MATFDERLYNHLGLIPRHWRSDRRDKIICGAPSLAENGRGRNNGNERFSGHAQAIPQVRREVLKYLPPFTFSDLQDLSIMELSLMQDQSARLYYAELGRELLPAESICSSVGPTAERQRAAR